MQLSECETRIIAPLGELVAGTSVTVRVMLRIASGTVGCAVPKVPLVAQSVFEGKIILSLSQQTGLTPCMPGQAQVQPTHLGVPCA